MNKKTAITLLLADVLLGLASMYAGHVVRFSETSIAVFAYNYRGMTAPIYIAFIISSSFLMELYNIDNAYHESRIMLFVRVAGATAISFLLISAFFYMMPGFRLWRGELIISLLALGVIQFLSRVIFVLVSDTTKFAKKVLVVGTGPLANVIGRLITSTNHNHVLSGYIQCAPQEVFVPVNSIISDGEDIAAVVKKEKPNKIVVSLENRRGVLPINSILSCKLNGVEVLDAPSFYEHVTGKLLIEAITPGWFIFSDGFKLTFYKAALKNVCDKVLALIALLITLPLLPIIALLIKLDSRGPVFYRQTRVSAGEKQFQLLKFRTMRQDAEHGSGAVWAKKNDTRVTRCGKMLRKTRLDELPQFINVLKGEMSFVGPRPERPEFVEQLKEIIPFYSERHIVKPGITGWAQVKYPYGASVEDAIEKLRYDLYYIKNLTISFDFYILIETVKVVLFGRGGR